MAAQLLQDYARGFRKLFSCEGVQQGDPLGPFLFALATRNLVKMADRRLKKVANGVTAWSAWYMDDGHLFGPPHALAAAFDVIVDEAKGLGIEVNYDKCSLWGPLLPEIPNAFALQKVKKVPFTEGITVLGIPVVADPQSWCEFVSRQLDERLETLKKDLEKVAAYPSETVRTALFSNCFGPHQFVSLLRGTDCAPYQTQLRELQAVLEQCGCAGGTDIENLRVVARLAAILDYTERAPTLKLPTAVRTPPPDYYRLIERIAEDNGESSQTTQQIEDEILRTFATIPSANDKKQRWLHRWIAARRGGLGHRPLPSPTRSPVSHGQL